MAVVIQNRRHHAKKLAFGANCIAQIEINPDDFNINFAGYPLLINNDSDSTFANLILDADGPCPALEGGGDIRIVTNPFDEDTRLAVEVQRLELDNNPSVARMELWIEAETVDATTGKTLYILWGIPGAVQPARDQPYGLEKVWDQVGGPEWVFVSHMNDKVGDNAKIVDSTPNNLGNNKSGAGTPNQASNFPEFAPFEASYVQDFVNNINYWIDIWNNPPLDMGTNFSVIFWARNTGPAPGDGDFKRLFSRKNNFNDTNGWEIRQEPFASNEIRVHGSSSGAATYQIAGLDWGTSEWYHFGFNFIPNQCDLMFNGINQGLRSIASVVDNNNAVTMGSNSAHNESSYDGFLDEVRLVAGNQQNDKHLSMYKGQKDPANHVTITLLSASTAQILPPVFVENGDGDPVVNGDGDPVQT